jgi:hypothetical protein
LFLCQVSVQFRSLETAQTKDYPHLMRQGLAPEEDDTLFAHSPLAKRKQAGRSRVVRTDANELLGQTLGRVTLGIDKDPNGPVE